MVNSTYSLNDRPLISYFFIALALHVFFLISLYIFDSSWFENLLGLKSSNVMIIESSVKVDVVGMPSKTLKELKLIDLNRGSKGRSLKEESSPEAPEESDSSADFKEIGRKKSFLDKLKKIGKKDRVQKKKAGTLDSTSDADLDSLILAGNKISKGASAIGTKNSQDLGAFQKYAESLPSLVRPFWRLPSYLKDKGLKCRIQVFINQSGKVIKTMIYESSGNKEYDAKALSAINKASPLPSPSDEIVRQTLRGEIVLGFPL